MGQDTLNKKIRTHNRTLIFHLIQNSEAITKQDIASELGLSLPTVHTNIKSLLNEGLICTSGRERNTGGRDAVKYSVASKKKVSIGLDITANHITVILLDLNRRIIAKIRERRVFERTDGYFKYIGTLIEKIMKDNNISEEKVLGVGIGVPGLANASGDKVFYGQILNFTGVTNEEVGKYIKFPVVIVNDAKAAGAMELQALEKKQTAFYLMLSNNVGGCVVLNGEVYYGDTFKSAEVGHICIDSNGPKCYCGQSGCSDVYCSATVLSNQCDGNLKEFFETVDKDPDKKIILDEYLFHLATTIKSVRLILDCEVILGGYVGVYIDRYIDDIYTLVQKQYPFEDKKNYISACVYKDEAIAAGAALKYINEYLEEVI